MRRSVYIILSGIASVYMKQKHRDFASEVSAINEELEDVTANINTASVDGRNVSAAGDDERPETRRQCTPGGEKPEVAVVTSVSVGNNSVPEKLSREKMGKLVTKYSTFDSFK